MSWFKHEAPREYARRLRRAFGPPTGKGAEFVIWENIRGYDWIMVRDEYITHSFPKRHHDFVYSAMKMPKIDAKLACRVIKVSGSIIVDLLKKQVQARCGGLKANDVTLNFVYDVIRGKTQASKRIYAKRINEGIIPNRRKFWASGAV